MKWNLDNIYEGFSSIKYKDDLTLLKNKLKDFKIYKKINFKGESCDFILDNLEKIFLEYENIYALYNRLHCFTFLKMSCNSNDKDAIDNDSILKDIYVDIVMSELIITKILSTNENIIDILDKSNILSEYKFFIRETIEDSKYLLKDEIEENIASLLNYGAYSYSFLQDILVSKYKVNIHIDGEIKEMPLTECRSMLSNFNREIRKEALDAEKRLYKYMEDPISFCLNNIKKSVIYDSKKRGYKSPLEKSLIDNRISERTLYSLLDVIKESLPLFRDFLRLKGKLIGDKNNKVYFSDLFAESRECNRNIDFDYTKRFLIDNFYSFSKKVGNFVENAFKNNWIDSDIYEGKVGGAFCDNIVSIKESRILMNFNNSYDSIFTLAHELGHAYHGEILKNERILNTNYPMTIAETASIFFETLICDKVLNTLEDDEKLPILDYELNSSTQTIVDIYSRFLFEKEVFERCSNEFLTPNDLNNIMKKAQKEAYGDAMYDEYFGEAWIYKSHYYDFNYNFYNYPYAFGLLFSLGLYSKYLKDEGNFHEKYEKLLLNSGKSSLESLGMIFNIDITQKEFFKSSIEILKNKYDTYKKLIYR